MNTVGPAMSLRTSCWLLPQDILDGHRERHVEDARKSPGELRLARTCRAD